MERRSIPPLTFTTSSSTNLEPSCFRFCWIARFRAHSPRKGLSFAFVVNARHLRRHFVVFKNPPKLSSLHVIELRHRERRSIDNLGDHIGYIGYIRTEMLTLKLTCKSLRSRQIFPPKTAELSAELERVQRKPDHRRQSPRTPRCFGEPCHRYYSIRDGS